LLTYHTKCQGFKHVFLSGQNADKGNFTACLFGRMFPFHYFEYLPSFLIARKMEANNFCKGILTCGFAILTCIFVIAGLQHIVGYVKLVTRVTAESLHAHMIFSWPVETKQNGPFSK